MKSNLKFIIFFAVVSLTVSQPFLMAATRIHELGRDHLSHTKFILEQLNSLKHKHLNRHNLNQHQAAFEQAPLQTNHYSFNLHLKVHGLDYFMSMDTGSSDIFIKGQQSPGAPKIKYFSEGGYQNKQQIQIGYLDGFLQTYVTELDVSFNNYTFQTPLLVAYTAPEQFKDVQGLIGLSSPSLARHQPTFIQTLMANNIVSKNSYGMNFNLVLNNRSFVTFGEADPKFYEGTLIEYPILGTSFINIQIKSISIGQSGQMSLTTALLDTGNTCISIPHRYQSQILRGFNTKNNKCGFVVQKNVPMFSLLSCVIRNIDELPIITLNINGNNYTIEKQFYLQRCLQNPKQVKSNPNLYYCDTYIESTTHSSDMIFLGDGFFNRFYTFFDLQNHKVGIAKNKENITIQDIKNLDTNYDPQDWKDLLNIINKKYTPKKQNRFFSFLGI